MPATLLMCSFVAPLFLYYCGCYALRIGLPCEYASTAPLALQVSSSEHQSNICLEKQDGYDLIWDTRCLRCPLLVPLQPTILSSNPFLCVRPRQISLSICPSQLHLIVFLTNLIVSVFESSSDLTLPRVKAKFFYDMQEGHKVDSFSLSIALSSCANLATLKYSEIVHS
ncbi:hypothetical protein HHK36_033383 [Tetracentron sinense]|uniref:Uncharacterized protein n=1 Tax=Tetracentron sinense TaxID=13715 RepID=A0A834Y3P4_TETSI|nr:hypothetical protein HHK36_033383 [Tetracentron sinense]